MFKSLANLLHRTPWWALFLLGLGTLVLLGAFTAPIRVIQLEKSGKSPEMNRAIKREIDAAFGDSALGLAENIVGALHERTKDPERKEELARAMEEMAQARAELRTADRTARDAVREAEQEARNALRDAIISARTATKEAASAMVEAQREALRIFKETGVKDTEAEKQLEDSFKAAQKAEEAAKRALVEARTKIKDNKNILLGLGFSEDKPLIDIQVDHGPSPARTARSTEKGNALPVSPSAPAVPTSQNNKTAMGLNVPKAQPTPPRVPGEQISLAPEPPRIPLPPLPPELRQDIHEKVAGDFYRVGLGAGLIVLFIPLFLMAVISKVFIDRSRAALRMAELKKKEAEFHSMNRQMTEAKLQALQAQVEPHFLYNTLANVQALTETDPPSAGRMIEHLIQYLRSALPKMRENTSTVGQEMELVRAYLNILKMRMGERLEFDISVPSALDNEPFPPLMLPSLVENAIKHGLEPQREGGRIDIEARLENGRLSVSVRDTGKGFGQGTSSGSGVGLANIRERLHALFGNAGKLVIEENIPHGAIATIEIPHGVSVSGTAAASRTPDTLAAAAPSTAFTATTGSTPKTWGRRTFSALGTTERVWRRALSWSFVAFVVVAGMACATLLGLFYTGTMPVQIGNHSAHGVEAMALVTIGVLLLFAVLVLAGALLAAVGYGLGALLIGLILFVPFIVIVAMAPVLIPIGLVILGVWWWVRRKDRKGGDVAKAIVLGIVFLVVFLKLFSVAPVLTTIVLIAVGIWWWRENKPLENL